MQEIQIKDIKKINKGSFRCLMQKTWKLMILVAVVMTCMKQRQMKGDGTDLFFAFLSLLIRIGVCTVVPFKGLQFLNRFYKEPEREYSKKRCFVIAFAYLASMIFLGAVTVAYALFVYAKLYLGWDISVAILSVAGIAILLLFVGYYFLSIGPMIYWDNQELTLVESCKISIRACKKHLRKALFFLVLIPFSGTLVVLSIFMFFHFFPLHYPIVLLQDFLIYAGYWVYFVYLTGIYYLFAKLAQGKNEIFRQEKETGEALEIQEETKRLKMIVCVGENNLIGDKDPIGNGLLWHSKEELLYYKSLTIGQVTLFGENTAKYVPLEFMKKTREVIVLSMDSKMEDILKKYPEKDIFICGGATIYRYYLENYTISQVYVSRLKTHVEVAEAKTPLYFPNLEELGYEIVKETEYGDFTALVYEKKAD